MFFIKKLKEAFRQGNHRKRKELLKAISEVIYNEYTEDNFYTRFSWLVEELLIADISFSKFPVDIKALKLGLAEAVDNAVKQQGNGKF